MDEEVKIKREKLKKMAEKLAVNEINVNDNNFEKEVIERSKSIPVLVDFWAAWCQPCLFLGSVLEKLVKAYNGKFVLAKLNVDEGRAVSQRYGIMSIPSVKLFKNGAVVNEFMGALPEPAVRQWLDKNLGD